jgi:hypothetical protein
VSLPGFLADAFRDGVGEPKMTNTMHATRRSFMLRTSSQTQLTVGGMSPVAEHLGRVPSWYSVKPTEWASTEMLREPLP